MRGIDVEALLGAGYAIFLALVAAALELLARHSHQRTQRARTIGFSYHADLDVWQCPNGKQLYRAEAIRESTVVRYRALAHQCNSCPIKHRCTDSDEGRVIEVQRDSWLQSELRNFHRGALADSVTPRRPDSRGRDPATERYATSCFSPYPYSALQVRAFDYRQDSFDRARRALGRMAQHRNPEVLSQLNPPILDNNSAGYCR